MGMLGAYAPLWAITGVRRLVTGALIGRLGGSMVALTLAFAVIGSGGSVAMAGLALTAYAVSLAAMAPSSGRLADRLGARRTLVGFTLAYATAVAVLIVVLSRSSAPGLVLASVALVGALAPPATAVLRAHWRDVVPPEHLRAAYALDSVSNTSTYVVGPPLASLLAVTASPLVALAVAAALKLAGDITIALSRGLARAEAGVGAADEAAAGARRTLAALRPREVRLLLVVAALDTFTVGSLDVLAISRGEASAGVLLGVGAVGGVAGGLVYGARRWKGRTAQHLLAAHLFTLAALVAIGATAALLLLLALLMLAEGVAGGARDTINQLLLSDAVSSGRAAETFGWLTTVMWCGFAAGTATAGQVHEGGGALAIGLTAASASAIAAVVTTQLRPASPAMVPA